MSGYKPKHKPEGPGGGQFMHQERSVADVAVGVLQVNKAAEAGYPEQVESIREAGLKGSLTGDGTGLTYTSPDGRAFRIHQDGHTTPDGEPGWAVDNHDTADPSDPAYGIRHETTTAALGDTVTEAVFDSAAVEAFTMSEGSDDYEFSQFVVTHHEGDPAVAACFQDRESNDDLDVYYGVETGNFTVYYADSEVTGKEADEVLKELVDYNSGGLEVPGGSPSQQMAWHMERSFRIAAAKDDSPEWTHGYRVDGLTWADRH